MKLLEILGKAANENISDIFIVAGLPLTFKSNGKQIRLEDEGMLRPVQTASLIFDIYELASRDRTKIEHGDSDDDFSLAIAGLGRFRINVFHQRGSLAAVIRVIKFGLPDPSALSIPENVMSAATLKKGIVLVTGQAGSGKSTTLACILDRINHTREGHILTLEDPVEFVHRHNRCIVSQREIFSDCESYVTALKSALRESSDVILLGEMRDRETMEIAMTAAETGELLFSSLHTLGAANTVDRIIDSFPPLGQAQIRLQLSMVLQTVISQQLVPDVNGVLMPVFEVMHVNPAIRNLIRESKTYGIDAAISAGAGSGMMTMDSELLRLYKEGRITKDTALTYCLNLDNMQRKIQ